MVFLVQYLFYARTNIWLRLSIIWSDDGVSNYRTCLIQVPQATIGARLILAAGHYSVYGICLPHLGTIMA